jgi:hypothetical protein
MVECRAAGNPRHHCVSLLLALACSWLAPARGCAGPPSAHAQPDESEVSASAAGLRGLYQTGLPLAPRELSVQLHAGYGVLEKLARAPAAEHRLAGGLALGVTPLPWLGFGLRLDGRLELHANDGMGSHVAGFGDPRLSVRAGHALGPEWSVGAELALWLPGRDAPSWVPSATSLDGRALAAYRPRASRLVLLGSLGVRLDNSANAAPPRDRLRTGDRITLGVSDSHAVLAAVGGSYRLDPRWHLLAELSGDVLVGARAPSFADSPLRAAGGARFCWQNPWCADASASVSLSSRPSTRPDAAWVPIEPRVQLLLGVSYAYSLEPPPAAARPATPNAHDQPLPAATAVVPAKPPTTSVQGEILDDRSQPLPDVQLSLVTEGGATFSAITDARGHYRFAQVPLGPAQLEAHAVGFATQRWSVGVTPDLSPLPARALPVAENVGVLRGLIRDFQSAPLRAKLSIKNARGKLVQTRESGDDGHVEVELPPGRYSVRIEAPGYRSHTQSVQIKGNGVSVLNADLRAQ